MMIYTELTKKALRISFEAHRNQIDRSGVPYIYHPYEVASHMDDEFSTCVALLHDVIEDTAITPDHLRKEGFPEEVVQAVICMTHSKGVPYMDYIKSIKRNPLATKVKLADLDHNSDLSRLDDPSPADFVRMVKYKAAKGYLIADSGTQK